MRHNYAKQNQTAKELRMSTAIVSSKGQITLPADLLKTLDLKFGDKLDITTIGKWAVLRKVKRGDFLAYVKKLKPTPGPVLTKKEIERIVVEQAGLNYERKMKAQRSSRL
jgi:AbrB family looped-hinge helix DNA binding protein